MPDRPPTIHPLTATVTAFVGQTHEGPVSEPSTAVDFADFARVFGERVAASGARSRTADAVHDYFRNGGGIAVVLRTAGNPTTADLTLLDSCDRLSLVMLPDATGSEDLPVLASAAAYCERRRAFLLVPVPDAWQDPAEITDAAVTALAETLGPSRRNAAIYLPRVREAEASVDLVDPAGAVAGVIARTDAAHGPWKAAAGVDAVLRGVVALVPEVDEAARGRLNTLGVNCLLRVPAGEFVVWGARTLAGTDAANTDWRHVPVRRTALMIEESVERGIAWATQHRNDEVLWTQLRIAVAGFLEGLFRQGAFAGTTPGDSYFVRCDAGTTTASDIHAGVVNVRIGFAPRRAAEFVSLSIQVEGLARQ